MISSKLKPSFKDTPSQPLSVFFYTFHKCASSLFSSYILPNLPELEHVDYAAQAIRHQLSEPLVFEERGKVYGPIRLSANPAIPIYNALIKPTTKSDFVKIRRAFFFLRDPRDILVSEYFSFGKSHELAQEPTARAVQEQVRTEICTQQLDQYCLKRAPALCRAFQQMIELRDACSNGLLLRYEELIDNFPAFAREMGSYFNLPKETIEEIRKQSRPRKWEDPAKHRRSGRTGSFAEKIEHSTAKTIDGIFGAVLEEWGYLPSETFY
jgi:hypothetical protein